MRVGGRLGANPVCGSGVATVMWSRGGDPGGLCVVPRGGPGTVDPPLGANPFCGRPPLVGRNPRSDGEDYLEQRITGWWSSKRGG
jgi:hypothetical protein